MQQSFIEFKRQRDFGQILGDTFGFLRNEFKSFVSIYFNICGPVLLMLVLAIGFYTYIVGDMAVFDPFNNEPFGFSDPLLLVLSALTYVGSALTAYVFSIGTTLFYIKSYIDYNGEVNKEEIRTNVHRSFWSILGLSFLKWITLFFAMMLCGLPVLYAMVPMAVAFSIYIFNPRKSVTDAYSDSFYLVNQDFWLVLGTWIVLGIIYYIVSLVFSLPTILYSFIKVGISANEIDPADMGSFSDPFYVFLNVLSSFVQFLINIIMVIGGAFCYFHLNEKKNFTGTYERIGKIGENLDE